MIFTILYDPLGLLFLKLDDCLPGGNNLGVVQGRQPAVTHSDDISRNSLPAIFPRDGDDFCYRGDHALSDAELAVLAFLEGALGKRPGKQSP